jgi:hypothetical protein
MAIGEFVLAIVADGVMRAATGTQRAYMAAFDRYLDRRGLGADRTRTATSMSV